MTMNNLAVSDVALGRPAEALKLHDETLAIQKVTLGPGHPDTLMTMYNVACDHAVMIPKSAGRGKEAERTMECLQHAVAAGFNNLAQMKRETATSTPCAAERTSSNFSPSLRPKRRRKKRSEAPFES